MLVRVYDEVYGTTTPDTHGTWTGTRVRAGGHLVRCVPADATCVLCYFVLQSSPVAS